MPIERNQPEKTIQVNIRLPISAHDRLAAWGYIETGSATPTPFVRQLILNQIEVAAEDNPNIDAAAQIRAERRAEASEEPK